MMRIGLILVLLPIVGRAVWADEPNLTVSKVRNGERNPRVFFIRSEGCSACENELQRLGKVGGTFESLRQAGWKIGPAADSHIQIVEAGTIPHLIEKFKIRAFPFVACVDDGKIIRGFQDGCSTPLDAYVFSWLLKGAADRPPSPPSDVTVVTSGTYPLRGNHWSVEDYWRPSRQRLLGHIRGPHGSLFPKSWQIESWAYEELLSLHDDLHESSRPRTLLKRTGERPTASAR
jgi:hypothetical protein